MNGNIENLITALQEATEEIVEKKIDIDELRNEAQSFLNNYKVLEKLYKDQKLAILKNNLLNLDDISPQSLIYKLSKVKNYDLMFTRSKYLLAFKFDDALTRFRQLPPKRAAYVYTDKTTGKTNTIVMSLAALTQLLNQDGRFGNPKLSTLLKLGQSYEMQNEQMNNQDLINHQKKVNDAYTGVVNRLNVYYNAAKLTGGNRQGGLLMWKLGRYWTLAQVTNFGDVKEAYVAGLMSKHKSTLDYLCSIQSGAAPYYSHQLIASFFNNYIEKVSNMAAIREEDVVTDSAQYAIKGARAAAPAFDQYLKMANLIIMNSNIMNKEELEEVIKSNWPYDIHRNQIITTIENIDDKVLESVKRKIRGNS